MEADDIRDLLITTEKEQDEGKWTDLTSDIQKFHALPNLLNDKRVTLTGGTHIQFRAMMGTSGNARTTGLHEVDNIAIADQLREAEMPWRYVETKFGIDEREIAMNRAPRRIVELYEERRADAMIDAAKLFESAFWGLPATSDTKTPHGIKYWINKHITGTSATGGGFNGTVPTGSGYTEIASMNPTTYARWTNWTFKYVDVSENDFCESLDKALEYTDFEPPIDIPQSYTGQDYGFYTVWSTLADIKKLLRSRNDNLGFDLMGRAGRVYLNNVPVMRVPQLDSQSNDTTDCPFYGINWGWFKCYFMEDWIQHVKGPQQAPEQHNDIVTWYDWMCNFVTKNRRAHFVGAKSASD